jgi:predicted metal-dependent hydrolase
VNNVTQDNPSIIGVAVRDLNRLRAVAVIAAKHGFGPLLMRIPLARRLFERLIDQWHSHPRFQRYPRPPLKIRAMRSRWGSLSPRTGMCLNLLLIHAPLAAIEYVVVHELCHLRYRGHGKGFYGVLESVLPDWRARKKCLETSCRETS